MNRWAEYGVVLVCCVGCGGGQSPTKDAAVAPVPVAAQPKATTPEDVERSDIAAIIECKWWAKRPTKAEQIHDLAEKMAKINAGNVIWMDDTGGWVAVERYRYGTSNDQSLWRHLVVIPSLTERRLYFVVDGKKRPERHEMIAKLRKALDAAEFADGPAVPAK
ncbi:hypothetical protein UFOVP1229_93 [uncultured Caudovirales phage]|uniref:Uncharacterized protein n=1 Tax=uncultured Caudovirales phage TaxID=2100421 RepID=A0A6J5RH74_9CAUD|nr:hypothetical protein UFOVP1229_93 [uncultured Caudovirales phage]